MDIGPEEDETIVVEPVETPYPAPAPEPDPELVPVGD